MPVSDALVVGEEWISEHYFTTDATKESFQARVVDRRKEWDSEDDGIPTTRSRFTAARGEILARLLALGETPTSEVGKEAAELQDLLLDVLGFTSTGLTVVEDGPVLHVTQGAVDGPAGLAVLRAAPMETVEDLIARHSPTLLETWTPEDGDPVDSVGLALSTLLTEHDGPTFALVLAGRWCLITERERWPEGRWLAVDLQLVCERNDTKRGREIDRALTVLDARSLAADATGTTWWTETLADSVRHTVGVSKDLQEGVRLSIEIIANEVLDRRRAQGLDELPPDRAQPLAVQSLRYLYRILFLLYAEASPELGVLPVGAGEYDAGYGLDRLRDLALREVHTPQARTGTHLYTSLDRLFTLVDRGHEPAGNTDLDEGLAFGGLRADLFRPEATAHIDEVGLGNAALLEVLRKLLLSKEDGRRQRGFVSYVELGINQLGAVYEGLMSYTGSFATEDLYEVAPSGDPSKGSWVVPTTRSDHLDAKDFVLATDPTTGERKRVLHRQGTFVFRLSGRDRQRSASYYTPEVLTRFTVGQALEELLDQDGRRTTAEQILGLTICEPALGSGAFALEAVRQLAEEYLTRREDEVGERVDPEARPRELAKVRAHLALHNVYGVDLNATAVELAEVSLWLDTMVEGLQAPWFGLRLRRGNSLVGARRALYGVDRVKDKSWLTTPAVDAPMRSLAALVDGDEARTESMTRRIHHFLLPAQGWGSATEVPKSVRDLVPDEDLRAVKAWRSSMRRKPQKKQVERLEGLARRVEILWATTLRRLRIAEEESSRHIDLWGRDVAPSGGGISREQIEESLADPNGAYRRLRLVMDAWCALWYWPLTGTEAAPPSLDEWLDALEGVLGRHVEDERRSWMTTLGAAVDWDELGEAEELDLEFALARAVTAVENDHPWLGVCRQVAAEQGFFHWELDFATVFAAGGFDLQVGNPPWVRPRSDVEALLAEIDPWWELASKAAEEVKRERLASIVATGTPLLSVSRGTTEVVVLAEILNSPVEYALLQGQPDLYRAFISQCWTHSSPSGVSGLIHLESHLTDSKADNLRLGSYRRLRRHWQFINELKLFDIQDQKSFGVNIYAQEQDVSFLHASALYHPDTVNRSLQHDGSGDEPGYKDSKGKWDTRPHASRIQKINLRTLSIWAQILGYETPASTPIVYSLNTASNRALEAVMTSRRASDIGLHFSRGWDESIDKKAGRFVSEWGESSWSDAILQGPNMYVSNPLYKKPNPTMKHQQDWTQIDLDTLRHDTLPVTPFAPSGNKATYDGEFGAWGESRTPARSRYRLAWRKMAANTGERTLISSLIPPGTAHTNSIFSAGSLSSSRDTVLIAGVTSSILADFLVRSTPKANINGATIYRLPIPAETHPLLNALICRTLRLNCLTNAYAALWAEVWRCGPEGEPVLPRTSRSQVGPSWTEDAPIRRAVDRRYVQVEIDALVALMLDVPIDDLCTIYRTQFAVLYGYDHGAYTYDANGRLVPTEVLQVWRRKGDAISEEERTAVHPGSGVAYTYELPFGTLDREADMRTAYAEFERRLAAMTGAGS